MYVRLYLSLQGKYGDTDIFVDEDKSSELCRGSYEEVQHSTENMTSISKTRTSHHSTLT